MNKTTKHLYFFLILIIIPITYSITLQELIDSYDYSYSSDKINLTGITYDHNDTDNNGLYNHLIINITVDNLKGNYTFIGDVYKNNELITTISDTYYLYDGQNTIFLYYDTRLLSNGIYNLSLTIQEDYLTVFRGDYIYDFEFNNSLYEKPAINISIDSYELIDNDNDNKKEVLRINAVVDSQIEGNFEINALIGNGKTINSKEVYPITNGINNINIDFDGMEIRRERINNSKLYSISINDGVNYQFNFDYPLVYNLYDFDAEQSVLADVYSDGKIDLNDNNLSEFLEINISLDINESGIYSIELKLEDLYSDYLTKEIKEFNLDVGDQIVSFRINGIKVYNKKLNGPYILEYIRLSRDDEILDSVDKAYTTNYYSYGEFERPLMPDLLIENVEILDENNLRVEIANVGEAYAFAFNLELFDDNFDHIKEIFIDYLAPAQSEVIDHELDTSELNKLHAIIDYDNQVEEYNESNNLFTYNFHAPPILQDIKNITINETDLINIVVDATDPNGDNLVYYINDTSRFILIENIFSWQTYLGDEGNYSVNITVSDGEFNVSQKVDIEVKGVRTVPEDGMVIISDTFFFEDIYFLPNGLTLAASNITLDCNNATLVGDGSSNAIYQLNQSFNTIKNCNIMNYTIGIFFRGYQNQNSIENKILNNFIRYMAGRGIYVIHTSLTEISDNYVSYSGTGIDLDSSSEIAAINNTIQDSRVGFSIEFTSYSVLRDNLIYNNDFNFGVYCPWDIQTCYQDIDNSNKVDGKDIAYIVGQENLVLDDSSIGYVALISSKNITITNLTLRNNLAAITLINSSDINITYNSIFDNGYGIMLLDTDNTFSGGVHIYYNDILDNDYISLHNYQEEDIIAEYNWWGTADPDAIEDVIYHHNDYSGLGFVDYMPNLINPFDYTNMPPILYLIDDIKINEADLVDILVNANDIEALTYYINDSRFNQDNNEFTWQTPDRSAGVYIVNISVSDGEFNVSQLITIEVHDKCLPNWVEINETCRSNDTSIGWYNDTNSCYLTTGLVSDLDNKPLDNTYSCDFCLPVWQCDGWDSCLINDTKYCNSTIDPNSCYSQTNLISDLYLGDYSEFNPVQCDFCIPKLLNTTWTEWYNTTACLAGNYVEQERNRTQYDVNFCGEVDNATYTETRTTPCNHCIPNWMQENNQCQTNDKQLISYTDTNNCNEDENLLIDNGTYLDCNYCNYNLVNTSWSEWINETSCLTNDLQQQYRFKTEHDLNYTSCYSETNLASDLWNNGNNITHYDYRDIPCDNCTPHWMEVNTTCQTDNTKTGYFIDNNLCYSITTLESDLENKPDNNTYSCNYCTSEWINTNSSCSSEDYYNVTYEYTNTCCADTNLAEDCNIPEDTTTECDFCTPELTNTTWTEWYNTTTCLEDNYVEQERNRTQYDVNFCNEINNLTYAETRTTSCNYCIPNWMQDNNQCQTNDKQLISYTDTNNCNEDENLPIDNGTYLDCNYCNYNFVNTSWSEWINETSCLTNDLQQQSRFKTEYDDNHTSCYSETNLASDLWNNGNNITHYDYRDIPCDNCTPHWMEVNTTCQTDNTKTGYFIDNNLCYSITTLESDLENKPDNNTYSCNYCTPEWINTNSTCAIEDYYNVTYEYTNTCCADTNLAEDCNIPEDTTAECDFCTPELTNTTWTDWYNITTCLDGNYVEQERNRTQYDVNFCNEINNVTYTETRTTQCNHCIPEWMQDNNRCQTDDKQLISYTDTNNCNEDENLPIDNGTYLDCNYCNYNFVNTSWSEWINETSCLTNDLQQQSRFKTEYDDNYTTCYLETNLESDLWNNGNNITNYDYRSVACDNCTPIWIEVNTTCQTDNTKIGYFVDDNGCYSITALESDLENKPDNNTYSCDYGYTFNIDLNEGWNLISIPLKLENETLPEPLKSIEGNYNQVLAYIDGKWGIYEPDGDHNSLYSINETIGFWIYMVNEDTLVVDGIESDVGINLNSGWNLIGYNSLNPSLINNILDGIDYSVVYGYDSGWKSYNIVRDTRLNSLENFEPGEGYWVKSNEKTIVHAGGVKEPSYRVFTVVENSNYILEWGDVGVFVVMDDNDNDGFFDDLTDETFEIYRSLDTNDDYELIGETNQFYGDNTIVFVDEFSNLEHGRIIYYKAKVKGTSIGSDESSIITCGMTGLECEPFGLICSFDWVCIPEADEWRVCFASMPSVIDLNPCFSYSSEPDYFGTECYTDIYLENQCGLGCVNGYCIE